MSSLLAIKLNFIALYSAITCITPYLSCYLEAYTPATSSDVGTIKLISSFIGMPINLVLCNLADRYRAHRSVYVLLVLATLVSFATMMGPMYWDQADENWSPVEPTNSALSAMTTTTETTGTETLQDEFITTQSFEALDDGQLVSTASSEFDITTIKTTSPVDENPSTAFGESSTIIESTTTIESTNKFAIDQDLPNVPDCHNQQEQSNVTITRTTFVQRNGNPYKSSHWFYIVSVAITFGTIASAISMNLLSSFAANMAAKSNTAYGTIRMWGALGRISSAITLSFINDSPSLLFLMPALILFTVWGTINLLLAIFWPSKEPFDLSEKTSLEQSLARNQGPKFKFAQRKGGLIFRSQRVVNDCRNDLECGTKTGSLSPNKKLKESVLVTKASVVSPFDTREEDMFRNIRRCSLAPLGDSYMIKQFELDEKSGRHFKHVTKLEPVEKDSSGTLPPTVEYCIDASRREKLAADGTNTLANSRLSRRKSSLGPGSKKIDIWLHLRILKMMIERNTDFIRFLFLIGAIGFTAAMNWLYFFPFIKKISPEKFGTLSAYTMIAGYITEALFYLVSPWFSRNFGYSASLSWILIIYGARYLLYLLFTLQSNFFPLELLIIVESLRPFNMGWLNCVYNESALDFALKARQCIPELIELGFIDDTEEAKVRVTNGFKATIVGIMSCCFDGIGIAFGALFGGYIIDKYSYEALWKFSAAFSILCGLGNFLFHLKCCEQPPNQSDKRKSKSSSLRQHDQQANHNNRPQSLETVLEAQVEMTK